jgi:acetoin utilization protein AcuB
MDAEKIMSLEVITVPPELSLEAAHRIMQDRGLRHLPVVAGQKLAGILSDRDLLLAIGGSQGAYVYPPISVGEVMSLAPVSAGPNASLSELARTMVEAKIDALPIITSTDVLIGLVTSTDLMRVLSQLPKDPQPTLAFQIRRAADLQARA